MPKMKTCKTAAKRFKRTATGKLMHKKAGNSHLFLSKSPARKRRLEKEDELSKSERWRVNRLLAGR
ncbi:MAG: 50S ribosomal protein L35 [Fimbriimonadales bacterium]|nr:50S ribosomal protein L35 [Fimbriimonadales bacterium]MDW8052214.1 50S ribosomal protein L35 [Armatimonadota bacterium]